MKTWKIPVAWAMMGVINVEAKTLDEAIEIAKDDAGVIPIPDNGTFLDGSWENGAEALRSVLEASTSEQE